MAGAMFCAECGSQLVGTNELVTQNIKTDRLNTGSKRPTGGLAQSLNPSDSWASLHLLDTGQMLPLSARNEFTMGRVSEGQPIMPDIDLSPYSAYAAGVSGARADSVHEPCGAQRGPGSARSRSAAERPGCCVRRLRGQRPVPRHDMKES